MKSSFTVKVACCMVFLCIGVAGAPMITVGESFQELAPLSEVHRELHVLRTEHYLFLEASDEADEFHVRFSFPPMYGFQVPLWLDIFNDTTAPLLHVQIEDDVYEPNKVVNFTIGSLEKDERVLLHFTCWALIKNHDFSDLPCHVSFPTVDDLPEETRQWLVPTEVVQVDSALIKVKARQFRGLHDNVIRFAETTAHYIKQHRYPLFVLQLNLRIFFSQDALTTLFINGENVGRSHLACALFRTSMIPARVLLVHNDQGFWTQMHYMVEYYCPGYGWVLLDTTAGETPYATKRQIINRICHPADEEDTKTDYIYPLMKGEERWLWIDNDNVFPYYVDCREGSKSQMFSEGVVTTDSFTADYALFQTRQVFPYYQQYLGMNLTGGNRGHFENATGHQKHAIDELCDAEDLAEYLHYIGLALEEYEKITV